jgi:hypothetical protein
MRSYLVSAVWTSRSLCEHYKYHLVSCTEHRAQSTPAGIRRVVSSLGRTLSLVAVDVSISYRRSLFALVLDITEKRIL